MAAMSTVWSLNRYARFRQLQQTEGDTGPPFKGSWEEYCGDEKPLRAVLHQEGQFVLTRGTTVMESIHLRTAGSWIRGTSKGDSVLLVCKIKEETRRFRMQFSSCNEQTDVKTCQDFSEKMSAYFPIKVLPIEKDIRENKNKESAERHEANLQGEVTLSKIAKVVTKEEEASFPAAYKNCCNIPGDQLEFILRLCLSDPTFPAFVEQVEQKLNKIKNN